MIRSFFFLPLVLQTGIAAGSLKQKNNKKQQKEDNPGPPQALKGATAVVNNDSFAFYFIKRRNRSRLSPHQPIISHFKVWDVFHNELNQKSI